MSRELLLLALFLTVSVVVTGVSIPLMLKLIKPNALYGWRTSSTLHNPEIWYPVNQVTGIWLFVTGQAIAAASVWSRLAELDADTGAWVTLTAFGLGVIFMLVHGNVVIRKMKRNEATEAATH